MFKYFYRKLSDTTLKRKIVFLVGGLVTITPTVLVAVFALIYYFLGVEKLFNDKIGFAISETVKIAELYLKEHKDSIKADILGVTNSIAKNQVVLSESPEYFSILLNKEAELRNLSEAMVFTPTQVLGKNYLSFSLTFERLPEETLKEASTGKLIIISSEQEDKVRAIIKLDNFIDTYLLVGRYVDSEIINYLASTKGSANLYKTMLKDKDKTQVKLEIAFIVITIILCLGSIITAVKLANIISRPINQLVEATSKIKARDFSVRVPERKHARDETAVLAKAFNSMTKKIAEQTNELISAKDIIDERRRFIEAILTEVSSGVLVINPKGLITLCNQSAAKLLKKEETKIINQPYQDSLPEILELLEKASISSQELIEGNITIERGDKKTYLFVRIGTEFNTKQELERFIITIDDMSKLIAAQRSAAWADVARRIAHEIKNPLTPINLSAEQLKRKFLKEIKSEPELFTKYVDTITRHVSDIGMMVEEFVQFARIPSPKLARYDLLQIINEVIFSQKSINPNIKYQFDNILEECYVKCDRAQITQVFFNLIKNSNEAIEAKAQNQTFRPEIHIYYQISEDLNLVKVFIKDNGQGIPLDLIDRISEPYITTKSTGTGLGLSIVKKIVEDHGGTLSIQNNEEGVLATFTLKLFHNNLLNEENHASKSA
ncbi:HAMP domain-containing protein [Holosporaceae bacterium 'Namur']|nr:HAMP domain-containing protein [Holosporaceae bacterium 'Namur']